MVCDLQFFLIASATCFYDSLRLSLFAHGSQRVSLKYQCLAHDLFKPFDFKCISMIFNVFSLCSFPIVAVILNAFQFVRRFSAKEGFFPWPVG